MKEDKEQTSEIDVETLKAEVEALKKDNAALTAKLEKKPKAAEKANGGMSINDYLNERVPFRAFKDDNKYKDDIVVIVNGYAWQIQRGVTVMIPRHVLHAIENSERQKSEAANHAEALANEYKDKERQLT